MKQNNRPHPRKIRKSEIEIEFHVRGDGCFSSFWCPPKFSSQKVDKWSQTTIPTLVNIKIQPCHKTNSTFLGLMPRSKSRLIFFIARNCQQLEKQYSPRTWNSEISEFHVRGDGCFSTFWCVRRIFITRSEPMKQNNLPHARKHKNKTLSKK